jgi:5-formyltetrahydrofolate cyclo-ligase
MKRDFPTLFGGTVQIAEGLPDVLRGGAQVMPNSPRNPGSARDQKSTLRGQALAERHTLSEAQIRCWSDAICVHLFEAILAPQPRTPRRIAAFFPLAGEVDLRPLLRKVIAQGELYLPKIGRQPERTPVSPTSPPQRTLDFHRVLGLEDLETGRFGLREPPATAPKLPDDFGLRKGDYMLVPGLAFDAHGGRLGFGAGYYDSFFAQRGHLPVAAGSGHDAFLIGITFAQGIVAEVPCEAHDRRMDALVSENGWRTCS